MITVISPSLFMISIMSHCPQTRNMLILDPGGLEGRLCLLGPVTLSSMVQASGNAELPPRRPPRQQWVSLPGPRL